MSAPAAAFAASISARTEMPQFFAELGRRLLRLCMIARPDPGFADRPHQRQRRELQLCLRAGAVDSGHVRVLSRQMFRRHCAGGGRAHVGQIAVVEQQRLDQSRLCRQQHHQSVGARQTELGIVEEARADLDGKTVEPRHVGRLHVDLAAMLGDVEPHDRRHGDRQRRQRAKGSLHAGNRIEIQLHDLPEITFGEDRYAAHAAPSCAPTNSPHTTCRCSAMSIFRPETRTTTGPETLTLPASSAAMPTAPAPSTTSRSVS